MLYSNTQTCFITKNENQSKAKLMIFWNIFVSIDLAWWCWKKMPTLLYFVWYCSTNLTARLVCRNALWRWLMKTILHETCELISVNKYKFTFTYCSRYQHYWKLSTTRARDIYNCDEFYKHWDRIVKAGHKTNNYRWPLSIIEIICIETP